MGRRAIDLTGQTFGRLTVLERGLDYARPDGYKQLTWRCRCECGTEVTTQSGALRSGGTQSCGCLQRERAGALMAAGPAHPRWKGDEIEYLAAHWRVRQTKGKASEHLCFDCDGPAKDWSYVGGCPRERTSRTEPSQGCRYSPDPDRYVPRCKSCHSKFDRARS